MQKILAIDVLPNNLAALKAGIKTKLSDVDFNSSDSLQEGLLLAKKTQPEVLIIDSDVADLKWLKSIKEDKDCQQITVIVISSIQTSYQLKEKFFEIGADFFVSSPIVQTELIAQLRYILNAKKTEERIRRNTEKYEAIYNNAPLHFQSLNKEGKIREVNPTWLKTMGYQKKEVIGKWFGSFLHEDFLPIFKRNFPKLVKNGKVSNVVFKLRKKDGKYIDVLLDASAGYTTAGKFIETYCTFKNITEETKQRNKLEASEAKYRSFAEHFNGIAFKGYGNFHVDFMSGKVKEITGYTEQDFIDQKVNFGELLHPDDRERVIAEINDFANSKTKSVKRKYRIINRLNQTKWLEESITKLVEANKTGVYGTIQDITQEMESQEQIRFQSEVLHNFKEGVVVVEAKNQTIVYNNTSFREMFDYQKGELFGNHISILFAPKEKSPMQISNEIIDVLQENEEWLKELKCISSKGIEFWCKLKIKKSIHPNHGKVWINIFENITERKKHEIKIAEQTHHLETIHTNAPISFWIYEIRNGKYYFVYQNKTAAEKINTTDDELIGKELHEIVPDILTQFGADDISGKFDEIVKHKKPISSKGLLNIKGKEFWWMVVYSPLFNEHGEVYRIISSAVSIDELVQKQNELKESVLKNKAFVEHFQGIAFRKNSKKLLDSIEGNIKEITGYNGQDFLSGEIGFNDLIHPDDLSRIKESDKQFEESDAKKNISEFRIIDKSGNIHWIYETTTKYKINKDTGYYGTLQDITRLKEAEAKTDKLTEAIEQSPGCVVITDLEGRIEYVNPAFSRITGYSRKEAIGQKTSILKSGHHDDAFYRDLWKTIKSGKVWQGEFFNKKKNGELFWEDSSIAPIKNKNGEIINFLAVKEDITEKKNILKDLELAKEKAEESDKLKTAFLANMSHEIRTPMNGILGFLDLLHDADLTEGEREHFFGIIKNSGDRLLNTINDIIEISKIETGEIPVELSQEDIGVSLLHYYDFFKFQAESKGIQLIYKPSSLYIKTDFHKLDSILTNLIKNAIKFTKTGTISFGFIPKKDKLQFYVKDTGVGIAPEFLESIFNRFVQADNKFSRGYEGSGLGLSICKAYVEMLGGEMWVESEIGKGSTFYFTIKYEAAVKNEKNILNYSQYKPNAERAKIQILVAEDDEVSYVLLESLFSDTNFELIRAVNGIEVLQKFDKNPTVSLILMDLKMPEMDGITATKLIREFNKEIPIIAQTAFALLGDRERALEAGCTDYLSKPLKKHMLNQILEKYIS